MEACRHVTGFFFLCINIRETFTVKERYEFADFSVPVVTKFTATAS